MALVLRELKFIFVLGEGEFGESGQNQLEISGLRATTDIIYSGGNGMGTIEAAIYGMSLSHMNQLSTLGMIYTQKRRNSLTVLAGDQVGGMATVYQGQIINAWPDMNGMPDVPFRVTGGAGLLDALAPAQTISIRGGADVATILSGLAVQMKLRFKNNGVSVKMPNQYYAGSARSQAQAIVRDAGIEWNAGANGEMVIWNAGQSRTEAAILVSKTTGMVGYPSYTSNGIMLRNVFNASMGLGSRIKVETTLKLYPASGEFVVYGLNHHLDCRVPRGRWFSDVQAAPPGSGPFTP